MATPSRDAHRRRVLEHQAKIASGQESASDLPASDAQLRIRLIGEARTSSAAPPIKRGRKQTRKQTQPELGKL